MATRRKKPKDHFDKVYDKYVGNDDEEVGVTEDTDTDTTDATDQDGDTGDRTKDPVAKAIADTEARMRHQYIKPLKAQLAQLRQNESNSKNLAAVAETVRTLRMENEFLPAGRRHLPRRCGSLQAGRHRCRGD